MIYDAVIIGAGLSGLSCALKLYQSGASFLNDRKLGDGKLPPLDRPPQTRQEMERSTDYLEIPGNFLKWFEWAMNYRDPAEQ